MAYLPITELWNEHKENTIHNKGNAWGQDEGGSTKRMKCLNMGHIQVKPIRTHTPST